MKLTSFSNLMVLGLVLTIAAASGCRKRPGEVRDIPQSPKPAFTDMGPDTNLVSSPVSPDSTNQIEHPLPPPRSDWPENREIFQSDTVHFAFDSSAVRSNEKSKITSVADYMKAHAGDALRVEGHCDERGTAEYNRSLGERRALALREELIKMGIDPNMIETVTFGFDHPVDPAHNESAWAKNRRGEFVLLTPPAK